MLFNLSNSHLNILLTITLLAILTSGVTACQDFEQRPPPETPEEKEANTAVKTAHLAARTEAGAILAVYEHLLSQAESYRAKRYLADFYTTSDNWSAVKEFFKDGTSLWHVTLDMTEVKVWRERPYWQQASWLVLREGKVMPSNRFQANALRIEADLQELSLPPPP